MRAGCFSSGLRCDNWNFNASNPVVYVGGNYNQNGNHGLFYVNYTSLTNTNDNHGSRYLLQSLANNSSNSNAAQKPRMHTCTDSRAPHWRRSAIRERSSTHRQPGGALERPYS